MTQQRTAALLTCILLTAGGVTLVPAQDLEASAVDTPATATRNASYVSNREPLQPSPFMKLPIGSVTPKGWLRHMLELEADGMTGRLEALSPWLNFNTSAWASPTGEGERGWEELPYWLKGYGDLGYVLHDETLIAEARKWIEPVLASQREDGWFGPRALLTSLDGKPDLWPHMVMLNILQSFYEFTEDPRVLPLMTRYFQWQNQLPATAFGEGYWPKIRAGDNIESVHWLYNRTGEAWLLELAQKIHDNMAPWQTDVINWHNVNIAQGFRAGTVFWPQSDDPDDLASAERNYRKVRDMYGQFGGGTWVGDENSRPGYTDPRGALETCAMVEFMHSAQMLTKITGDPVWADRCEEMALNSFPASQPADQKGLHYLTAPNMVLLDRNNKAPGLQNGGCMLAYDPHGYRCCQHNVSHGWPYYAEELWLATPDNGLCASLYAASEVEAKVGEGAAVKISEQTDYPFRDTLRFTLSTPQEVRFPLYLRIPRWCEGAKVSVNGEPVGVTPKSSQYVRLERSWKADDRVDL
ncbi:MAG: transcriptional initiation protein Tat, partial [Armatimonadetes bacterium CG_4_10_14_0_8_um_filter_66_14]